jgi:molybdopterin synthase catalytic subunit
MGDSADFIKITTEKLNLENIVDLVGMPEAGAIATFVGTTRNHFEGKTVVLLEYEAYVPMAENEISKICATIRKKWNVVRYL